MTKWQNDNDMTTIWWWFERGLSHCDELPPARWQLEDLILRAGEPFGERGWLPLWICIFLLLYLYFLISAFVSSYDVPNENKLLGVERKWPPRSVLGGILGPSEPNDLYPTFSLPKYMVWSKVIFLAKDPFKSRRAICEERPRWKGCHFGFGFLTLCCGGRHFQN